MQNRKNSNVLTENVAFISGSWVPATVVPDDRSNNIEIKYLGNKTNFFEYAKKWAWGFWYRTIVRVIYSFISILINCNIPFFANIELLSDKTMEIWFSQDLRRTSAAADNRARKYQERWLGTGFDDGRFRLGRDSNNNL